MLKRLAPALVSAALLSACFAGVAPAPVVQHRQHAALKDARAALHKVAVLPFYPVPTLSRSTAGSGNSAAAAAELVTRFVTEALAKRGIPVIAANDLEIAFAGQGQAVPRLDPLRAAALAAEEFGATGVLLGEVTRYRERGGEALGTTQAASVAFEVILYTAPAGQRVWSGRFDETQRALSENVFNLPRYPGGGTRWLTAAELARWGADSTAESLPER